MTNFQKLINRCSLFFGLYFCYTDIMKNINPAPPQNNFNETLNFNAQATIDTTPQPPTPSIQPPVLNNQAPLTKEEPIINKKRDSAGDSNKLWIILLVFLAMIVGFWIGYFTHEYFYQSTVNQENLTGEANQLPPAVQSVVEPVDESMVQPSAVEKEYIIFKDEESYVNDGLNFTSQEQCVEDEIAVLTSIEDDYVTIQINQWTFQEDSAEYLAEKIDFQVKDQECLAVRPICPNVFIDRCFSLENIDGVYHLDYEFREEGEMPQSPDLEPEL